MRTLAGLAALAFFPFTVFAQQPLSLEDLRLLVGISSVETPPDGTTIAVVVPRANFAENKNEPQLCAVDVAAGTTRPLTFGRARVSDPAFAPDGRSLAFVAPDAAGHAQVWLLALAGGEARCWTNSLSGVSQFSWRPDGRAIAYAGEDEPPKLEGEARHIHTIRIGDQDLFLKEPIQPQHIWIQPLADGPAKRLTSGSWSLEFVLPPSSGASPLSWSKDGREIAFARVPNTETGQLDRVNGAIVDVETGAIRSLNGTETFQAAPTFAPAGDAVVYRYPRDGKAENIADVYLTRGAGDPGRNLTRAIDRNLFTAEWLPGGKELLVAGNDRASVGVWVQPLEGPA